MTILNRFPVIRTDDPASMEHALLTVYGASRFDVAKTDSFEGVGNYLQLTNIGVGYCAYGGATTTVDFPESDFARVQIALRGRAATILGGAAIAIDDRQPDVVSPGRPTRIVFEPGYEQMILRIKNAALQRTLTSMLGAKPRSELRFEPAAVAGPTAPILRELTMFLASQLNSTSVQLPEAVRIELEQALIVAFLSAHRHNFSDLLEAPEKEAAPRIVRQAEEYMEASWNRAITLEDLAAHTNASVRALHAAFKKCRGYSPVTFAKTVRLRRARQLLEQPDSRTSVSGVAFKCGFGNLGHFAKDFREMFGELPSEILSRARRGA
jgi:AraC-like DNA-binding protein